MRSDYTRRSLGGVGHVMACLNPASRFSRFKVPRTLTTLSSVDRSFTYSGLDMRSDQKELDSYQYI